MIIKINLKVLMKINKGRMNGINRILSIQTLIRDYKNFKEKSKLLINKIDYNCKRMQWMINRGEMLREKLKKH